MKRSRWLLQLERAVAASDEHAIAQLLQEHTSHVQHYAQTADPQTRCHPCAGMLQVAIQRGNSAIAALLLTHGCVSVDAPSGPLHITPLARAAARNDAVITRFLLAHGAHVDGHMQPSPLLVAIESGAIDVVSVLLAHGANPNATGPLGVPALNAAARHIHSNGLIVQLLLAHGANIDARATNGQRALHVAAASARGDAIELLAAHPGVDINARDACGRSPLHCAAAENSSSAVRVLVAEGADVDAVDARGRTALHVAVMHTHPQALAALLASNASAIESDSDGRTPLAIAARFGKLQVLQMLLSVAAVRCDLVESDPATNAISEAVAQHRKDVVQLLQHVVK